MSDVDPDGESWLDDYEEGSTTEELIHRMRNGMLLWDADTPPEVIAAINRRKQGGGASDP